MNTPISSNYIPSGNSALCLLSLLAGFFLCIGNLAAQDLTVERIDDYVAYPGDGFGYEVISTMGRLRPSGQFVPFASQDGVGGWMPGGEDAPYLYPVKSYWTFASYVDLNVLRTSFPWFEFWWPDWQSTEGSGIIRVRYRGGSTTRSTTNVRFGSGSARWRAQGSGSRNLSITIPSIRRKGSASRSGSLRVDVAVHRSSAVYTGRAGTIIGSISYNPLPSGYYYPAGRKVTRLRRTPAGRLRSALHLKEYTSNRRFTIADTRRFGGTVRLR